MEELSETEREAPPRNPQPQRQAGGEEEEVSVRVGATEGSQDVESEVSGDFLLLGDSSSSRGQKVRKVKKDESIPAPQEASGDGQKLGWKQQWPDL